jgi:hypothetical protein
MVKLAHLLMKVVVRNSVLWTDFIPYMIVYCFFCLVSYFVGLFISFFVRFCFCFLSDERNNKRQSFDGNGKYILSFEQNLCSVTTYLI